MKFIRSKKIQRKLRTQWNISCTEMLRSLDMIRKKYSKKIFHDQIFLNEADYYGCTFYFDKNIMPKASRCNFENCSFRSDVNFDLLIDCTFENCGFSNKVGLRTNRIEGECVTPYYLGQILNYDFLTSLSLYGLSLDDSCWGEGGANHGINFYNCDFSKLQKLEKLYIANLGLTKLPESICELKNLRYLDCYDNEIKSLPEKFGNLKKLVGMDIHNNRLYELSKIFGELDSLEDLYIQDNPIGTIHHDIFEKNNLRKIVYCGHAKTAMISIATLQYFLDKSSVISDFKHEDTLHISFEYLCKKYIKNCVIVPTNRYQGSSFYCAMNNFDLTEARGHESRTE